MVICRKYVRHYVWRGDSKAFVLGSRTVNGIYVNALNFMFQDRFYPSDLGKPWPRIVHEEVGRYGD